MSSELERMLSDMEKVVDLSPKELVFQPDYNDEDSDSDLLLFSSDGQGFRVHSLVMKLASGVFKIMIDVASGGDSLQKEQLHLQEDGSIIESLLDLVYPNKLFLGASVPSIAHLRDVCYAAEKYEMPGVLHTLRVFLRSTIDSYPALSTFALASRYEWEAEKRLISTATLSLDLYSAESKNLLQLIPTNDVIKLMELHRARRDVLVASLDLKRADHHANHLSIQWSSVLVNGDSPFSPRCACPWAHYETPRWAVLEYCILEEMERMPDGSSIRQQGFWDRSEFDRIWTTTCSGGCGGNAIVCKHKLKEQVIRVLDNLPKTI